MGVSVFVCVCHCNVASNVTDLAPLVSLSISKLLPDLQHYCHSYFDINEWNLVTE